MCTDACTVSNIDIKSYHSSVNKFFKKLLKILTTDTAKYCQDQFGFKLPSKLIVHCIEKFNSQVTGFRLCVKMLIVYYKKLGYRRETARQLPTWRGLSPPVHFPSPSSYTYAYGRIRNPQQRTPSVPSVKRTLSKLLNRAFKVIQGYPYLCRQEPRAVYCRNVQLMSRLFLKLTKIWHK